MARKIRIECEQRTRAGSTLTDLRTGAQGWFNRGEAITLELGLFANGRMLTSADMTSLKVRFKNGATVLSETIITAGGLSAAVTAQAWRQGNGALISVTYSTDATGDLPSGMLTLEVLATLPDGESIFASGTIEAVTVAGVPGEPPTPGPATSYTKIEQDAIDGAQNDDLQAYADDALARSSGFGRCVNSQFLQAWYAGLLEAKTGDPCVAVLVGDSTQTDDYMADATYSPDQLLLNLAGTMGIKGVNFINGGVSGINIDDWLDDYFYDVMRTADLKLLQIRLGINHTGGYDGVANFETKLRTILTRIRDGYVDDLAATIPGRSPASLAIQICTPSATDDALNLRDAPWYEALNPRLEAVALEFGCNFLDIYTMMRDCEDNAEWGIMDDIGGGHGVHPLDMLNTVLVSAMAQVFFPSILIAKIRTNNDIYIPGAVLTAPYGGTLSQYLLGRTVMRAVTSWPFDGFVETIRHVDGGGKQTNWGTTSDVRYATRQWNIIGAAWTGWTYCGDLGVNVTAGTGYTQPGSEIMATYLSNRSIFGTGYLTKDTPGTITSGTVIGTVDSRCRPVNFAGYGITLTAWDGAAFQSVTGVVDSAGSITTLAAISLTATRIYLSGSWNNY